MIKTLSIILPACACVLLSCSKQHATAPEPFGETGVVEVCIHMDRVGALQKALKAKDLEIKKLNISLPAEGQTTVDDTIQLTGGIYGRTERKTYPELAAFVDGKYVKWTLSVQTFDQDGQVIHSGVGLQYTGTNKIRVAS
jgi:hypothetical protein